MQDMLFFIFSDSFPIAKSGNELPVSQTMVQRALRSANQEDSSDCTKR